MPQSPLESRTVLALDEVVSRITAFPEGGEFSASKIVLFPAEAPYASIPSLVHSSNDDIYPLVHITSQSTVSELGCYIVKNVCITGDNNFINAGVPIVAEDLTPGYWRKMVSRGEIAHLDVSKTIRTIDEPVLSVLSLGYMAFGHWLVDILPRLWLYQSAFSDRLPVLVPRNIPNFGLDLLQRFGVTEDRYLWFDPGSENLLARLVFTPSHMHNNYTFHPAFRQFTRAVVQDFPARPRSTFPKKLFVSRRKYLSSSAGENRTLINEPEIAERAQSHGFSIVYPEELTFPEKVSLFANADCVLGEFGSGMHLAMFSAPGTVVICIGIMSNIQGTIGAVCGHRNVYIKPVEAQHGGRREMTVSVEHLDEAVKIAETFVGLIPPGYVVAET